MNGNAFTHIHFLFTCWWMARAAVKAIRRLGNRHEFPAFKQSVRPFHSSLEFYAEGRSHFDHFEERLPGGKKEGIMTRRIHGGLLNGKTFVFANSEWDVSAKGSEQLRNLGIELRKALSWTCLKSEAPATAIDLRPTWGGWQRIIARND